ncbi:putative translation initiation factor SUI1 [Ancylostoma ceylanicum]|uniref:Putative translation initiation factor SUI1 n=1 Tax=Ancylostoma ceylanicum TaxID=53326 RepID=A0A0D6LQW0_9BILA|nr:putative translation initiation factor SUI1 [Ancylostoma ceylanicum]
MASITNLNKPKDAFEQLEDEHGARQGFCHIRIQQRTGRKTITTVQGVGTEYDLKRIVRFLKKASLYSFGKGNLASEGSEAHLTKTGPTLASASPPRIRLRIRKTTLAKNADWQNHVSTKSLSLPAKIHRILNIMPASVLKDVIHGSPFFASKRSYLRQSLLCLMLVANIAIALYCGLRHQVGPYSAADAVISMAAKQSRNASVAALMPCYSIPGHSYFHNSVSKIRMLDCSPQLGGKSRGDEADQFHHDPLMWLDKHWNEVRWYTYILMYEKTYLSVADWMTRFHYAACDRKYSCNGTIVEHPEYGEVMQLSGDQRQQIKDFLVNVGIVKEENCKVHGF